MEDFEPLPVEVLPLAGKLCRDAEPDCPRDAEPDCPRDAEPDCASESPTTNNTITTAMANSGTWK